MGDFATNNYMVNVSCMTYNQASYIEDALNGFCMQQTTFPFICAIIDDASTDGEQEVIKSYLSKHFDLEDKSIARNEETDDYILAFARHRNNLNCFFAVLYLKYNHYSIKKTKMPYVSEWQEHCKYIALCEGDDYWTDPNKLQKQVSFLEENVDYTMCFSNAMEHWENRSIEESLFSQIENKDYTYEDLYKEWIVPTASVVYVESVVKKEFYRNLVADKRIYMGDTPLFMTCAKYGKVRGMSDVMTVYRRNAGGLTSNQSYLQKYRLGQYYKALYEHFGNELKQDMINKVVELYIQTFIVSVTDKNTSAQWFFVRESCSLSLYKTLKELFHHLSRFIKKRIKLNV